MNQIKTLLCGAALTAVVATPALADFPIRDAGVLQVGVALQDAGFFENNGNVLFGLRFTLDRNVTQGSGYGLILDSFGSFDLGSDTELALYTGDGLQILAINDDYDQGDIYDAYIAAGDAPQPNDPFNGTTRQGNITNEINLLAGEYLVVIGPYNTTWDSFDAQDTEVNNFQGSGEWLCSVLLYEIPAPGSLALLGLGSLAIGGRRRRA
ncbi:MAG: PEP-CTERM sorting domain-containing protein [Phycisphaerales bacterium]|nr:PEP-CTERM sorting domain-containing protein [Phycisphaerales bacterium]